jgi:hypothetical protein
MSVFQGQALPCLCGKNPKCAELSQNEYQKTWMPMSFLPLKPQLVQIIFKNSVRTAKKTLHFTITKINLLILFKEIVAVYIENHTKHINTKCNLLFVKAGGTYSYHWAIKG